MKSVHIISTLALFVFGAAGVSAKSADDRQTVLVKDFELVQERGGEVTVDFTLVAGSKAAPRGSTLSIIPVLTNGSEGRELTPVVIRGRNAKIIYKRKHIASPRTAALNKAEVFTVDNGHSVKYHAVVPFEEWMVGSVLSLKGIEESCCSATYTDLGFIVGNLMVKPVEQVVEETFVVPRKVPTTGERLADKFPFVKPADGDEAYSRDGITVYFHQAKHDIDQNYRQNRESLIDILSVVKEIQRSGDSEVERIVIAGFASPEGTYDYNMRLSKRRSEAVRKFIFDNSTLGADRLSVYAGGEDWEGLREMVSGSDMRDKQAVLDIIDHYPIWDSDGGRESKLKRLRGGETYRYLYDNFFPELREAAFITVYYKNK